MIIIYHVSPNAHGFQDANGWRVAAPLHGRGGDLCWTSLCCLSSQPAKSRYPKLAVPVSLGSWTDRKTRGGGGGARGVCVCGTGPLWLSLSPESHCLTGPRHRRALCVARTPVPLVVLFTVPGLMSFYPGASVRLMTKREFPSVRSAHAPN